MSGQRIRIGKIVGFHGLRGDVKLRPSDGDPNWTACNLTVWVGGSDQPLRIESVKPGSGNLLVRFQGKTSRNDVEGLLGKELYADRADLPEPDEGEYWVDDLIGLAVLDYRSRQAKGRVKDVLSSSGSDFLEIQLADSAETVVVPFIERFFPEVDQVQGVVCLDLLSDFIDEAQTEASP